MCSLTPNASCTTITAPRASPSGVASYNAIAPSGVVNVVSFVAITHPP